MNNNDAKVDLAQYVTPEDIKEAIAVSGTAIEATTSRIEADKRIDEKSTEVKNILQRLGGTVAAKAKEFWDWIVGWFRATFMDPRTGQVIVVTVIVSVLFDMVMPFFVTLITLGAFAG